MSLLSLFALFALLAVVAGHGYLYSPDELSDNLIPQFLSATFERHRKSDDARRRCGMELVKDVRRICNGCTRPVAKKRFMRYMMEDEEHFRAKREAVGLADQCCQDKCTDAVIRLHCC